MENIRIVFILLIYLRHQEGCQCLYEYDIWVVLDIYIVLFCKYYHAVWCCINCVNLLYVLTLAFDIVWFQIDRCILLFSEVNIAQCTVWFSQLQEMIHSWAKDMLRTVSMAKLHLELVHDSCSLGFNLSSFPHKSQRNQIRI